MSDWIKDTNEWVFQHPWAAAALTFALLIVTGTVFRLDLIEDAFATSIAGAGAHALVMSVVFGVVWDRRRRRECR